MWAKQLYVLLLWIGGPWAWAAQAEGLPSGLSSFGALRLPVDASVAALGDYNVSHTDNYAALVWQNPALLGAAEGLETSFSFLDYYADIRAGSNVWRMHRQQHAFGLGVRYLSYGQLPRYDTRGEAGDDFSADTQLLFLGYGHRLGPFALGVALLPARVAIDRSAAYGLFVDMGATFTHPRQELRIGLVLKHVALLQGALPLASEHDNPLDIWLGISYRPVQMPFRFSWTLYDLARETYYHDPDSPIFVHQEAATFLGKALGKCNFGVELLASEVLRLQSALTVARRQQLRTNDLGGLSGFSFGIALKLRAFVLQATRSFYGVRGGRTHVGVQVNFDALRATKEETINE